MGAHPISTGFGALGVVHVSLQGIYLIFTVELLISNQTVQAKVPLQALRGVGLVHIVHISAYFTDKVEIVLESSNGESVVVIVDLENQPHYREGDLVQEVAYVIEVE